MNKSEEIRQQLESQRRVVEQLEEQLRAAERVERDARWFPHGFYLAYYVLAGMVLGAVASWIALGANVLGAAVVGLDDPLRLLRVYSTILGGASTAQSNEAVVLVFATGLHTFTGVLCGTPIHVVYSRFFIGQSLLQRLVVGAVLGVVMWLINFYGILSWLQPVITGEPTSYIVNEVPPLIGALTHIVFAEVMVLLQPFAVFNPRHYDQPAEPSATSSEVE